MAYVRKETSAAGRIFFRAGWRETGADGKSRERSKSFEKERDARLHAAQMEVAHTGVVAGDPEDRTVSEFFRVFVDVLESQGKAPATVRTYGESLAKIGKIIGPIKLRRLSASDLDRAYALLLKAGGVSKRTPKAPGKPETKPLSPASVRVVHTAVHAALQQARKWRWIVSNPAADATPPSTVRSAARNLADDEIRRLLTAVGNPTVQAEVYDHIDLMVSVLMLTGMRRGELAPLAFDQIDAERSEIVISRTVSVGPGRAPILRNAAKTQKSLRRIKLPPAFIARLQKHRATILEQALKWGPGYQREPLLLFPNFGGEMFHPDRITKLMKRVMRRAKVKGAQPCHAWRHSCATDLLAAGLDAVTVAHRLGHSSPRVTLEVYGHVKDERAEAAANLMGDRLASLTASEG
ncbi:tyrosine-type recombinase/integrase [Bosea sp. BH3]|uniref:tyrosine-type recombinase/integrase n=1 Tax=Bosea sp. BH3 TaxID=2871701 RepID=UPI0021CB3484|nr:site-specific integrase [Bosea sp. BH3]MCU4180671.1 site-specific integrase [Bosea sp. BH3]